MKRAILAEMCLALALIPALRTPASEVESDVRLSDPLRTWQVAQEQFSKAGKLIASEQYQEADNLLELLQRQLPTPYRDSAAHARKKLQDAFQRPKPADGSAEDDPFGGALGKTELDYSYRDGTLKGYYQLNKVAGACAQLECY